MMSLRTMLFLILMVVGLALALALYIRHKSGCSKLCLDDLLMGEDGRMSKAAFLMMGAFAMTTWLMIYLALTGKMSEGYLTIYGGLWIGPTVVRLITHRPGVTQPDKAGV